jgi:hypothetical protein
MFCTMFKLDYLPAAQHLVRAAHFIFCT